MSKSIEYIRRSALAAAVVLFAVVPSSDAHQQWLVPNFTMQSGESAWVSFDHTFSDSRFQAGSGPGSYYRWWVAGPDTFKRPVTLLYQGKTKTVGEVELEKAGTYRLEGVEAMMPWTLLKIDDKESWYSGSRDDFEGAEIVRSTLYFQKVLSYVTLDTTSRSVLAPTGDPLEIVFEDHPNKLREGQDLRFRVLASGEPLAGQTVNMFPEGGGGHDEAERTCTSDDDGSCRIALTEHGRYLLVARAQGDSQKPKGTDGYVHTVSIALDVSAAATQSADDVTSP